MAPRRSLSQRDAMASSQNNNLNITSKTAGIVHKISLENFLCHDSLEMVFNEHINFIIGKNGSGKSAILTGIVVALGQKASATCRGTSIKDFIKTGRTRAVVRVTLINRGPGAYMRETYGDLITVERVINQNGGGGYKIFNENGRSISNKREDLNRILAKMNLQVDNPVCILNQETAKNFLHSNDPKSKYLLFERATQMDVMTRGFAMAEEELARSKSCLKEKISSLEQLRTELKKWRDRNEWYQAIDEVNEKRSRLENMIAWAQIEVYEKEATAALKMVEDQKENLEKLMEKTESLRRALDELQENHRQCNEEMSEKRKEVLTEKSSLTLSEQKQMDLKKRQRDIALEMKQLEVEARRYKKERDELMKAIDEARNSDLDAEYAARKEKRNKDLEELKRREEELNATRKVTESHMDQLKSAVTQYRNEAAANRMELGKIGRELDPKIKSLDELNKSGGNQLTVFGNWIPRLLERFDRMPFNERPRGPAGAFIKVRDQSWASAIENILNRRLSSFICSTDHDTRLLNRMLDEMGVSGNTRPTIITSRITGTMYDVSEHRVVLDQDHYNRDIHCLMDIIDIEDPDVANMLIDMVGIESVVLIAKDGDARHLMSDRYRVPRNCRIAYTKEGNTYHPDPNYKSYAGRVGQKARYLQVSVEETIRVLEEEIEFLKQERDRVRSCLDRASQHIQNNDVECRTEENRLNALRKELHTVREKIRSLESQQEPEPPDVLTFEEDLTEIKGKLDKHEDLVAEKKRLCEQVDEEYQQAKQEYEQLRSKVGSLTSQFEPSKDMIKQIEAKQRAYKEKLHTYTSKEETMRNRLQEFEMEYENAQKKVETEAQVAEQICPRMRVGKSLKSLHTELKQIVEQLSNHEKEYGSREHVLTEFLRRKEDYDRAKTEVQNSNKSLQTMTQMAKKRKDFIANFRRSIMIRTHYVFQGLLRNRNFDGELRFNPDEKTLVLMVSPPGRNDVTLDGPPQKRSRGNNGTDIRSLSGGERSYATVCFIISLWDAIESPFRVLDEFDVFMDEVNRRVSMDLLINEANENFKHQYIFLTPLGLDMAMQPNLSIFKMGDPDRRAVAENEES